MMVRVGALWPLVVVCACGGDDDVSPVIDGGAGADAGPRVEPPDIPWLAAGAPSVALAPCPTGWREIAEDDYSVCDPYPEGGAATCGAGEAHFIGEPGCRPVGAPCPLGDFADGLPSGNVVYVRAGAPTGGDGSLAAPFALLSETAARPAGATIALSKGTHVGSIVLRAGEELVGACAAETVLTTSDTVTAVVVSDALGEPAVVRSLTIADSAVPGVAVGDGRRARIEGVILERTGSGVLVYNAGAALELDELVIRDSREEPSALGRGISVLYGARISGARLLVERARDTGLFVYGAATEVMVTDAAVRETRPETPTFSRGRGIVVDMGARLSAERLLVEDSREYGMFLNGAETEVTLTDAVVRRTLEREIDRGAGGGIAIQTGPRFEGTRLLVDGNREGGVLADASAVVLSDAVIRNTDERLGDFLLGHGLHLQNGSQLSATRVISERNTMTGVFLTDAATGGAATDLLVRSTQPNFAYGNGGGIVAQNGSRLELSRARLVDSRAYGVMSIAGSSLEMTDVAIEDVIVGVCTGPSCTYGYGAAAVSAGVSLSRFTISGAVTCGSFVARVDEFEGEPALDLADGVVSGAQIGACVQVPGYDLARLTDRVEYRDNGTSLDTTSLPVPELVPGT